ncbi:hypothetical protein RB600_002061 [Gaeumannomyces tritici]
MSSFPQQLASHFKRDRVYMPVGGSKSRSEMLDEQDRAGSIDSDIPLMESPHSMPRPQSWFKRMLARLRAITMPSRPVMINLVLSQLLIACLYHAWQEKHEMNGRLKAVSLHSPLLDRVNVPLVLRQSFAQYGMGGNEIWRAEPSEDVDKAWEAVTAEHIIPVKHSDIVAMRKDPSEVVAMPPGYEVDGEQTYMAKAAAFHNIHCLDWLRKAVYRRHYYPNGTDEVPFYDYHTAHCIMILFEHLTCYGDSGVYLYRWMERFDRPIADTNIWRKCWDFETVLQEHNDAAVKDMVETDVKKPKGAKEVEAPWQILKIISDFQRDHDANFDPH